MDAAERADVEKLAHSRKAEARLVERAAVVWRCLQGRPTGAIAAELKLDRRTVHQWLRRFDPGGLAALEDAPRSGRPATYSPEERAEVVAAALHRPQVSFVVNSVSSAIGTRFDSGRNPGVVTRP